jgi:hypothetical protein
VATEKENDLRCTLFITGGFDIGTGARENGSAARREARSGGEQGSGIGGRDRRG